MKNFPFLTSQAEVWGILSFQLLLGYNTTMKGIDGVNTFWDSHVELGFFPVFSRLDQSYSMMLRKCYSRHLQYLETVYIYHNGNIWYRFSTDYTWKPKDLNSYLNVYCYQFPNNMSTVRGWKFTQHIQTIYNWDYNFRNKETLWLSLSRSLLGKCFVASFYGLYIMIHFINHMYYKYLVKRCV